MLLYINVTLVTAGMIVLTRAGLAHLVEQLICNHQVVGSSPTVGTTFSSRAAI
jgi:hypothetical protein